MGPETSNDHAGHVGYELAQSGWGAALEEYSDA